jgi:hypothetical protein
MDGRGDYRCAKTNAPGHHSGATGVLPVGMDNTIRTLIVALSLRHVKSTLGVFW